MKVKPLLTSAKNKFQTQIAKSRLIHMTTKEEATLIKANGFKRGSYFSFKESDWPKPVKIVVSGALISEWIYPDPEHMLDHAIIARIGRELVKSGSLISFETVTKHIDKERLFELFFEINEKIEPGQWLYCDKAFKLAV